MADPGPMMEPMISDSSGILTLISMGQSGICNNALYVVLCIMKVYVIVCVNAVTFFMTKRNDILEECIEF